MPYPIQKFGLELEYIPGKSMSLSNQLHKKIKQIFPRHIYLDKCHNALVNPPYIRNIWILKCDSSCGIEFNTPPLHSTTKNFNDLLELLTHIKKIMKGQINKKCGYHVHIDISQYSLSQLKNIFDFFRAIEPLVFKIYPSRIRNSYVQHLNHRKSKRSTHSNIKINLRDKKWKYVHVYEVPSLEIDHMKAVNVTYRKTLEIRYAKAATNPTDILCWLFMLLIIVHQGSKKQKIFPRTIPSLIKWIKEAHTNEFIQSQKPQIIKWIRSTVRNNKSLN